MAEMQPSERKLLFVLVREALAHPGADTIDTAKRNPKTVQTLRSLGFIATNEDSLIREAFLAYFETFEELECPRAVHSGCRHDNLSSGGERLSSQTRAVPS